MQAVRWALFFIPWLLDQVIRDHVVGYKEIRENNADKRKGAK